MDVERMERVCREWMQNEHHQDAAHDLTHIERVVDNARKITEYEKADMEIVLPAAWLHDCVLMPKDHPERKKAATLAAQKAVEILAETDLSKNKYAAVAHAIEAHSFSGSIAPATIEAKIVQDADRLDALGAIGIARCFSIGGQMGSAFYHPGDPFAEHRDYDEKRWTLDHFYTKLFRLPEKMHTKKAKKIADERVAYMVGFLDQFATEIV